MKKMIKKLIHTFGLDIQRLSPASNLSAQLLAGLNHVQSDIMFDIGGNIGQFAQELRSVGFDGKIISFEPLTRAHAQLSKSATHDSNWLVHPRVAVGDRDGEIEINIAGNSVSSSVLPMLDAHSSAAIDSAYVASERTILIRLDTVANQYLSPDSRPFIKIDTQGFEWQVLDGASETLKRAQGVLLELSLVPLYEGQRLWREIIDRMEKGGFTLWAIQKGFTDVRTGRSLQVDGIFLRQ
jgi:FkbM family methyltransferase